MPIPDSLKSPPSAPQGAPGSRNAAPAPGASTPAGDELNAAKDQVVRLEARVRELQQQVNDLTAAARTKDALLADCAQALQQLKAEQGASQAQAAKQLEVVRMEARLYRDVLDGVVQLGDNPALILDGCLGECIQSARRAVAAYPGGKPAPGSVGATV